MNELYYKEELEKVHKALLELASYVEENPYNNFNVVKHIASLIDYVVEPPKEFESFGTLPGKKAV